MKKMKLIMSVLVLWMFLNVGLAVSANPPPIPIVAYGSFEYSLGNPTIPAGVLVEAKIGGITFSSTITTEANKYYLQIPSDNPETTEKEGGSSGDVVEFYFDGFVANETIVWPGAGATLNKKMYIHHAPVLTSIGGKTVDENAPITFTITASDIDEDTIAYSATPLPSGATINTATGEFSWTPAYSQSGTYDIDFTASDGDVETTDPSETVRITVNNVNRAPSVGTPLPDISFDEDTQYYLDLDSYFSDPDGDSLSYSITGNTNVQFDAGIMNFSATGNWFGTETINIHASDGIDEAAEVLQVTVNSVNDAPVADSATKSTNEDAPTNITLSATDVDGDTLAYNLVSLPERGSISIAGNIATYTPDPNYNGADSFAFNAYDGTVNSSTASVSITINAVNDAPLASDGSATTNEDVSVDITLAVTDFDGDALTYAVATGPAHGSITLAGNVAAYTPDSNYNGADSFTFKANDGALDSNTATISLTINAVNDAPVLDQITDITVTVKETIAITPRATDVDSSVTYSINDTHFTWNGTAFLWITVASDAGEYDVEVTATDGELSDAQVIHINVKPEETTFTKQLYAGWNLVSIPVVVENTSISNVLASIDGSYDVVYVWDATLNSSYNWVTYSPEMSDWMNDLKNIDESMGFWVHMTQNETMNITGKIPYQTDVTLYANEWNLVGYPLLSDTAPGTVISGLEDSVEIIDGNFEIPNYWETYIPDVGGTMSSMKQGYGYWIKNSNVVDKTLQYINS